MTTESHTAKKYDQHSVSWVEDILTVEKPLQITINGEPYTMTMRTPGDDLDLVRGLLITEDIYSALNRTFEHRIIEPILSNETTTLVEVSIDKSDIGFGFKNKRNLISMSSCGICGKLELGDFNNFNKQAVRNAKLNIKLLNSMFAKMNSSQATFSQSGGSHAAAGFSETGELLAVKEDIGRHNAVDKVIGNLAETNNIDETVYMLVSGRVSYEIVVKAYYAGIPILAAISAPSSLAVETANSAGITLLGFCRNNKATVYTNLDSN